MRDNLISMDTKRLTLLLLASVLASCASITRGSKEVLVVDSTPQAATVQLSTGQTGTTPASFKVPRRDPITVTVSKPGFYSRSTVLQSQIAGAGGAAMAGNLVFGGLIGAAVDAGTGAMYEHKPNPLNVTLDKAR